MTEENVEIKTDYIVYLLTHSTNTCTYIGSTNNPSRRIRQHNQEILGGAKYTTAKRQDGFWSYYGQINNLNRRQALSIEKRIQKKHKKVTGRTPLERRLNAIKTILSEYDGIDFIPLLKKVEQNTKKLREPRFP